MNTTSRKLMNCIYKTSYWTGRTKRFTWRNHYITQRQSVESEETWLRTIPFQNMFHKLNFLSSQCICICALVLARNHLHQAAQFCTLVYHSSFENAFQTSHWVIFLTVSWIYRTHSSMHTSRCSRWQHNEADKAVPLLCNVLPLLHDQPKNWSIV